LQTKPSRAERRCPVGEWTKEPWGWDGGDILWGGERSADTVIEVETRYSGYEGEGALECSVPDRDRIVQCVNACAGLADPVEALRVVREALEWYGHPPRTIVEIGLDQGVRARAALALTRGEEVPRG
jgi:hypothetical protein